MSKDDVLETVGSPNRTQRIDGKDKWAYRFYTDTDKNQWDYRQVTFLNGKVISAGVDTDELNHLKNIGADDKAREDHRTAAAKAAAANPSNGTDSASGTTTPAVSVDATPETRIPTESDFVEVKGKHEPVQSDSEK